MKLIKLCFILLLALPLVSSAEEGTWSGYLMYNQTDFGWNQVVPLDQAKSYTYKSQGVGVEKMLMQDKNTKLKITGSVQVGNYGNIFSFGGLFRPDFQVSDQVLVGPEFNLGFDYFDSNSSSPHSSQAINFYSKIGPRVNYKAVGLGIYNYYSSLSGQVVLQGWSTALYYNF